MNIVTLKGGPFDGLQVKATGMIIPMGRFNKDGTVSRHLYTVNRLGSADLLATEDFTPSPRMGGGGLLSEIKAWE